MVREPGVKDTGGAEAYSFAVHWAGDAAGAAEPGDELFHRGYRGEDAGGGHRHGAGEGTGGGAVL